MSWFLINAEAKHFSVSFTMLMDSPQALGMHCWTHGWPTRHFQGFS